MYCSKCGAQNQDNAAFCSACGAPLAPAAAAAPPGPSASPQMPVQNKSPVAAAILNLFWGIGYAYLGYRKVLGLPTVGFIIVMFIVYIIVAIFTLGLVTLLLAVVLAIDGYQKAKGEAGFISAQK